MMKMKEEAQMRSLQIRDLPEDVYEALAYRAEVEHRSLAQQAIVELRRIPELTARERRLKVLEEIEREIALEGTQHLDPAPEDLIREDRER